MKDKLLKEIENINKRLEQFKYDIKGIIEELPDNPNINRLNKNCYTISMSQIRNHGNMSPEFYDFKYQYNLLIEKLDKTPVTEFIELMDKVIESKKLTLYQDGRLGTYKLHPEVVENIKKVWR
jgi:hypothetical protein